MNTQTTTQRRDIYEQITRYVAAALEKGDIIWKKPWNTCGLPKNIATGNAYRGSNVFLLNFVTLFKGYEKPYFITFRQAQQLGGHIKKGEKGYPIIYWARLEDKFDKYAVAHDLSREKETVPNVRLIPKIHTVFNIAQTEGISLMMPATIERSIVEKIAGCEQIIGNMPTCPQIIHKGDQACYIPSLDQIWVPAQSFFHSDEEYYCTLFHEMGHSTGHRSRLNREELQNFSAFGGNNYSKEELTAELTAAYLCGIAGIEQKTINNSAAYVKGWLEALNNDKRLFLKAASQAQAAADYILGTRSNSTSLSSDALNLIAA